MFKTPLPFGTLNFGITDHRTVKLQNFFTRMFCVKQISTGLSIALLDVTKNSECFKGLIFAKWKNCVNHGFIESNNVYKHFSEHCMTEKRVCQEVTIITILKLTRFLILKLKQNVLTYSNNVIQMSLKWKYKYILAMTTFMKLCKNYIL